MLKRLPLLCAALLALAACSHDGNGNQAASTPVPTTTAASARVATTASAASAVAPASSAAPAAADTSAAPAPSAAAAPATEASTAKAAPPAQPFVDNGTWVVGTDYSLIDPAQPPPGHPGKVVVTEVFSYACPACNAFHTTEDLLVKSLPSNAVMTYLPAAFRPDENWPVYQRAYFAAKALGVADKTYDAMFDATWKTGETATYDLQAGKPKPKEAWPKIEDLAKFYAKYGVNPKEFVAVANSFAVNTEMKRADDLVKAYAIDGTPSIVVAGKYRFSPLKLGPQKTIALTTWLVAKEAAGK